MTAPIAEASAQSDGADVLIRTSGLTKVFKDFWRRPKVTALSGLDLEVRRGEIFGLLGPNGSGKTTFIKILLGLLFPTSGTVKVFGDHAFLTANKARIGFLPESSYFYDHLSGRETLEFYARLLSLDRSRRGARIEELLDLVKMGAAADRPLGEYSSGMLRRIGLAQAILADPELLILDEPTNGLDPVGMEDVERLILELKARGKTILLCSHLLSEVENICDRVSILFQGRLLMQGPLRELLAGKGLGWNVSGPAESVARLRELALAQGLPIEFSPAPGSLKQLFLSLFDQAVRDVELDLPGQKPPEGEPEKGPDEEYLRSLSSTGKQKKSPQPG